MYEDYSDYVSEILKVNDLSNFKRNPRYTQMLEHVTPVDGFKYLNLIRNKFNLQDNHISMFCKINDSLGNPYLVKYSDQLIVSPSSLRYMFQSLLILSHIKKLELKNVKIVEVGCGYGGLALALYYFKNIFEIDIKKYYMVDLTNPLALQKEYLKRININLNLEFYDSKNFGEDIKDDNLFFISNYCFSEIHKSLQEEYIKKLLPKCNHGFITWNAIELYDFSKNYTYEDEYPLTYPNNKYVYF